MNLYFNHTSIGGSESSLDRQENTAPDVIVQKVSITPEKFKDDVEALVKYIGEEHLVKYLREERNILLTIKTNKKNGKE